MPRHRNVASGKARIGRRTAAALFAALLALSSLPVHAFDPLTLFLLRMVRDKMISHGLETAVDQAREVESRPAAPALPPAMPLGMNDENLRRLVDEGFIYLSRGQREEVYESVRRMLLDPQNARYAPDIVSEIALKASAVRQALDAISRLPDARKHQIAYEAGEEYARMPAATRDEVTELLRQHVVPLPADLSDMIVGEIDRVRLTLPPLAVQAATQNHPAVQTADQAVEDADVMTRTERKPADAPALSGITQARLQPAETPDALR